MRTTLKRGIGRSTGVERQRPRAYCRLRSSRRSAGTRQPPPPDEPAGRRSAASSSDHRASSCSSPRRRPAALYLYCHESVAAVAAHSKDVKVAQKHLDIALAERAGDRARRRLRQAARATTRPRLALRHDDAAARGSDEEVDLDAVVPARPASSPIYCRASATSPTDRINAAYAICGSKGALDTVKQLTGLPINYLITVNFNGFKRSSTGSAASGSTSTAATSTRTSAPAATNYAKIDLQPGYQKLEGAAGARLRALPAHRLGPLPARAPAAVRQGDEAADLASTSRVCEDPEDRRRGHAQRRDRAGRRRIARASTIKRYALFAYGLPSGHIFQAKIDEPRRATTR